MTRALSDMGSSVSLKARLISEPYLGDSVSKMTRALSDMGSSVSLKARLISEPYLGDSVSKMTRALSDMGSSVSLKARLISEPYLGDSVSKMKQALSDMGISVSLQAHLTSAPWIIWPCAALGVGLCCFSIASLRRRTKARKAAQSTGDMASDDIFFFGTPHTEWVSGLEQSLPEELDDGM